MPDNAIIFYCYSFSTKYRTYDIRGEPHAIKDARKYFDWAKDNFLEHFSTQDIDIYAHIWSDDYFKDEYLKLLNPKEYIISKPSEMWENYGYLHMDSVGPRLFQMVKLREMMSGKSYRMAMLRRFDMIFRKYFSFKDLNSDKVYIFKDYQRDGKVAQYNNWHIDRINDVHITCSYENMIRFLGLTKEKVEEYLKIPDSSPRVDHFFILCKWLKDLGLFDKVEYFLRYPYDVVLCKYFEEVQSFEKPIE